MSEARLQSWQIYLFQKFLLEIWEEEVAEKILKFRFVEDVWSELKTHFLIVEDVWSELKIQAASLSTQDKKKSMVWNQAMSVISSYYIYVREPRPPIAGEEYLMWAHSAVSLKSLVAGIQNS